MSTRSLQQRLDRLGAMPPQPRFLIQHIHPDGKRLPPDEDLGRDVDVLETAGFVPRVWRVIHKPSTSAGNYTSR